MISKRPTKGTPEYDAETAALSDPTLHGNQPAPLWTPFAAQARDWAKYGPVKAAK